VAGEHKSLMDAALAHDADLAVTLFEAHIDRTRSILVEAAGRGVATRTPR
jgi:DNA-binding GntR family transcriptional regulator